MLRKISHFSQHQKYIFLITLVKLIIFHNNESILSKVVRSDSTLLKVMIKIPKLTFDEVNFMFDKGNAANPTTSKL